MTYEQIAAIDPEIERVRLLIPAIMANAQNGNFWIAWESVKKRFTPLVGFDSQNSELRTSGAYDVVYGRLFHEANAIMPDDLE